MVESALSNPSEIKDKIYKCQMVGFEKQHLMFNGYNLDKSYKEVVNNFESLVPVLMPGTHYELGKCR